MEKPVTMLVYSSKTRRVREVELVPSHQWGGQGLLGVSIRSDMPGNRNILCNQKVSLLMLAWYIFSLCVHLFVSSSQAGIVLKWLDELSWFLAWGLPSIYHTLCYKDIWQSSEYRSQIKLQVGVEWIISSRCVLQWLQGQSGFTVTTNE